MGPIVRYVTDIAGRGRAACGYVVVLLPGAVSGDDVEAGQMLTADVAAVNR